jgi:hypothetical protein
MFIFALDRELIDDEIVGIKSYQALWMRIQNEVDSNRFNRFSDIIDLDRLAKLHYSPEMLTKMSALLAEAVNREITLGSEAVSVLMENIAFAQNALPRAVNKLTLGENLL